MDNASIEFKAAVLPAMAAVMVINEMELLLRFLVPIASGFAWHFLRKGLLAFETWYAQRKKKRK